MIYFLRHFIKYKNSETRFSEFSPSWKTSLLNLFPCLINPFVVNGVYKSLKENESITWKASKVVFVFWEAVVQRCSVKKMLLEISQNSQENNCARVSFLIKLQASGFFWIPFFLIVEVSFLHILYEFHEIKLNVIKYTLNCISWNSLK